MDPDTKIHLKRTTISIAKVLSSPLPVVGTLLGEFLDYRSQVKLERLCRFFEEFMIYIESMDSCEVDQKHLKSEEFGDIFESVLRRVVNTASEEKVHRFKKILHNEMKHISKSDFKETFLDIAFRINEDQILILKHFRKVKDYESEGNSEQRVVDGEGAETSLRCKANFLGFDEAKYLFYVQDLVSKSLLFDETIALFGGRTKPYTNLRITPFGEEFLGFVEGSPDQ